MLSPTIRYTRGFRATFRGFNYLRKNKGLLLWVLPPALVNTLITILALVMLISLSWWLISIVWPMYGDTFWQWVFKISVSIGIVLGVIAATAVVWLILTGIVAGYLLGVLAGRVERRLGLDEDEIHDISLIREGTEALLETSVIITIHALAFLAQFVPVVGTMVAMPAVLITDAFVFGWEIMSHPMGVRGMTLKERSAFIKRHRPETLGLGSTVLPTAIIPIVGGFVMCFATIGAVLLYRELIEEERSLEANSAE